MRKGIIFLALIFLLASAYPISTDGNYDLLQTDVYGSGDTSTDGNYTLVFFDAGEPLISKDNVETDRNYTAGIGFLGEPREEPILIETIEKAITDVIFMILPQIEDPMTAMMILGLFVAFLFIMMVLVAKEFKKRSNKKEEGDEEDGE